ncbi:Cyclin-B2-4, partial [Bienertia sinuspersici]
VHYKFELRDETLFLTVNLIDRFLAKHTMKILPSTLKFYLTFGKFSKKNIIINTVMFAGEYNA